MEIQVIKAGKVYKEGKYEKFELEYSRDGKSQTRKLANVADSKPVFFALKDAQEGDVFEIEMKKEGQFWNWVGAESKGSGKPAASGKASSAPVKTSTYETSEERTMRQLYIARQSSISSAVNALGAGKAEDEYLDLAQAFVDFVYNGRGDGKNVQETDDFQEE